MNINGYLFDFVNQIDIESSWDLVTDTAKIVIPKKITYKGKPIVVGPDSLFKRGDKVTISFGYGSVLHPVFSGYISAIKPKMPIEITCQDDAYILKQEAITRWYPKIKLKDMLKDVLGTLVPFETNFDLTLTNFRISNATPSQVLEELRKDYGVVSFFRDGKLYVGFAYLESLRQEVNFDFQNNVVSTDDLEYRREDDIKIKVKAIGIKGDKGKKRVEVIVGDPEGELRTLNYYNKDEEELTRIANEELKKLKYEGYAGNFVAFGEPFVRHSYVAVIKDKKVPEREGKYLIKSVKYSFGMGGIRQTIELDRKISGQL